MILQNEFTRTPEIVFERNWTVMTQDEFRYYCRLENFIKGWRTPDQKFSFTLAFVAQR
jgi:hypothetical protein